MWDGVDRRKFGRAEYPCLIKLRKGRTIAEAILSHTEDLSIGGVRVIIPRQLEVMSEVEVEIDLMDTLPPIVLKGKVSRVKTLPSGRRRYDIGIGFVDVNEDNRRRIHLVVNHVLKKSR